MPTSEGARPRVCPREWPSYSGARSLPLWLLARCEPSSVGIRQHASAYASIRPHAMLRREESASADTYARLLSLSNNVVVVVLCVCVCVCVRARARARALTRT